MIENLENKSENDDYINFWEISAENVNDAIRNKNILNKDYSITIESLNRTILEKANENTYKWYIKKLKIMDNLMFKNNLSKDMIVYRNCFSDIWLNYNVDEEFICKTYTSCCIDKPNIKYGIFMAKVIIKRNTPYLHYNNTIILPAGIFKIIENNDDYAIIELMKYKRLFEEN